jgi:hypothetical protein
MEEDNPLVKAFLALPLLAAVLFAINNGDWVSRNADTLLPIGLLVGAFLFSRIFPTLWGELRGAIPILLVVLAILGGVLYVIFGGGADSIVGFNAKDREQYIDSLE